MDLFCRVEVGPSCGPSSARLALTHWHPSRSRLTYLFKLKSRENYKVCHKTFVITHLILKQNNIKYIYLYFHDFENFTELYKQLF